MILTCPECSTSYMAKDDAIGPNGRTVRCAKCSATWFVPAPVEVASTPDDLQLADITRESTTASQESFVAESGEDRTVVSDQNVAPMTSGKSADAIIRDKAEAEKRRRRRRTIWLIWLIPILFIFTLIAGLYFSRTVIAERFPATVPLYNAVGVEVSQTGLQIDKPTVRIAVVNGQTTVVINGSVKNISNQAQSLPMLRLSLNNPAGEEVANWMVDFEKPVLKGQERVEFASEYPNPPPDSTSLRYRLAE